MNIKINSTYIIYGKMNGMKRFKPISGDRFVTNLIYADLFHVTSEDYKEKLKLELIELNKQGEFKLKKVG